MTKPDPPSATRETTVGTTEPTTKPTTDPTTEPTTESTTKATTRCGKFMTISQDDECHVYCIVSIAGERWNIGMTMMVMVMMVMMHKRW